MSENQSPNTAYQISIIDHLEPLAAKYDVLLCDIWGVIHNGKGHFGPACAALQRFRTGGGTVILITNAPRPYPPVLEQLKRLGVPAGTFDAVVTSGDVTLQSIADRGDAPLHHIGPARDLALFEILQQQTGLLPALVDLEQAEYVVCTGLFDDDETPDDYQRTLETMLAREMTLISANPDIVVHVGNREIYCSGAIAQRYEEIGGKVVQAGKPFGPIYDRALELAHAKSAAQKKSRILAIGDGLNTDIKGAAGQGFDTLFITSGVHRAQLHPSGGEKGPGPLDKAALKKIIAASGYRPVAAMDNLVW